MTTINTNNPGISNSVPSFSNKDVVLKKSINPFVNTSFENFVLVDPKRKDCDGADGGDLNLYYLVDPFPSTVYRQDVETKGMQGRFSRQTNLMSPDLALDSNQKGVIHSRFQAQAISALIDKYEAETEPGEKDKYLKAARGLICAYFNLMNSEKHGINLGFAASKNFIDSKGKLTTDQIMHRASDSAADLIFIKSLIWLYSKLDNATISLTPREINFITNKMPEEPQKLIRSKETNKEKIETVINYFIERMNRYLIWEFDGKGNKQFQLDSKGIVNFLTISEDYQTMDINRFLTIDLSVFRSDALLALAKYDKDNRNYWLSIRKNMFEVAKFVENKLGFIPDQFQISLDKKKGELIVEEERDIQNKFYEQGVSAAQFMFELFKIHNSKEEDSFTEEEKKKFGIKDQAGYLLGKMKKFSFQTQEAKEIASIYEVNPSGGTNKLSNPSAKGESLHKKEYSSLLFSILAEEKENKRKEFVVNGVSVSAQFNLQIEPAVSGETYASAKKNLLNTLNLAVKDKEINNEEWEEIYSQAKILWEYLLDEDSSLAPDLAVSLQFGWSNFDVFLETIYSDKDLVGFKDSNGKIFTPSKEYITSKRDGVISHYDYFKDKRAKIAESFSFPSIFSSYKRYSTQRTVTDLLEPSLDTQKNKSKAEKITVLRNFFQNNIMLKAKLSKDQELIKNCIKFLDLASYPKMENNVHEGANMISLALGYLEEALSICGRYDDAPIILKRLIDNPDIFGENKADNNPLLRLALIKATRLLGYAAYYTDRPQIFSNLMETKKMLDDYNLIDGDNYNNEGILNKVRTFLYGDLQKEDVFKQVYSLWIKELLEFMASVAPPHLALSYCNIALGLDENADVNPEYKQLALFNLYQHLKDDSVEVEIFNDQFSFLKDGGIESAIKKYLEDNRVANEYRAEFQLLRGMILKKAVQYEEEMLGKISSDYSTTAWLGSYLDQNQKAIESVNKAIDLRLQDVENASVYVRKMDNANFFFQAYKELMSLYVERAKVLEEIWHLNPEKRGDIKKNIKENMDNAKAIALSFMRGLKMKRLLTYSYQPIDQSSILGLQRDTKLTNILQQHVFTVLNIENNSLLYADMIDMVENARLDISKEMLDFIKVDPAKYNDLINQAICFSLSIDLDKSFIGYANALRMFQINVPTLIELYLYKAKAKSMLPEETTGYENELSKARLLGYIMNEQDIQIKEENNKYKVQLNGEDLFDVSLTEQEKIFINKLLATGIQKKGIINKTNDYSINEIKNNSLFKVAKSKTTIELYNQLSAMGVRDINLEELSIKNYSYLINNFTDDPEVVNFGMGLQAFAPNKNMNNDQALKLAEILLRNYQEVKQGKGPFETYFWTLFTYGELKAEKLMGQIAALNDDVQLVNESGNEQKRVDGLVKFQEILQILGMYLDSRLLNMLKQKSVKFNGDIPIVDAQDHKKFLYMYAIKFINLIADASKTYEISLNNPTVVLENRAIIEASLQNYQKMADRLISIINGESIVQNESDHWIVKLFIQNKDNIFKEDVYTKIGPTSGSDLSRAVNKYMTYKGNKDFQGIKTTYSSIRKVTELYDRFAVTVVSPKGKLLYFLADDNTARQIHSIDLAESMLVKARLLDNASDEDKEVINMMLQRDLRAYQYLTSLSDKKNLMPVPLISRFGDVQEIATFAAGSYYVGKEPDLSACYKFALSLMLMGEQDKAKDLLNNIKDYEQENKNQVVYVDALDAKLINDILSYLKNDFDLYSYFENKKTAINKLSQSFIESKNIPEWIGVTFDSDGSFTTGLKKANYMGYRAFGLLETFGQEERNKFSEKLVIEKRNKDEIEKIYGKGTLITSFYSELPYRILQKKPHQSLLDRFLQSPVNNLREALIVSRNINVEEFTNNLISEDKNTEVKIVSNKAKEVLKLSEDLNDLDKILEESLSEGAYRKWRYFLNQQASFDNKIDNKKKITQVDLMNFSATVDDVIDVVRELNQNSRLGVNAEHVKEMSEQISNANNIVLDLLESVEDRNYCMVRKASLELAGLNSENSTKELLFEKILEAMITEDLAKIPEEFKGKVDLAKLKENKFINKILMGPYYSDYRDLFEAGCTDEVALRQFFLKYAWANILSSRINLISSEEIISEEKLNGLYDNLSKIYNSLNVKEIMGSHNSFREKYEADLQTRKVENNTRSLLSGKVSTEHEGVKRKYYFEEGDNNDRAICLKILEDAANGKFYSSSLIRAWLFFVQAGDIEGSNDGKKPLKDLQEKIKLYDERQLSREGIYPFTLPVFKLDNNSNNISNGKTIEIKIPGNILIDFIKNIGQGYN